MANYARPPPLPHLETREYWDGARAHQLRAQRCSSCGKLRWPPQGFCPHCYSWESGWIEMKCTGAIQSFVVIHKAIQAFAVAATYALSSVLLGYTDGRVERSGSIVTLT